MRGRRESFVYGQCFMALVEKLKAPQIKEIERKCRAYLKQIAALRTVAPGAPASSYVFPVEGGRYRLVYDEAAKAWVLKVVRAPPKNARNRNKPAVLAGVTRLTKSRPRKPPARKKKPDNPEG